MGRNRRRWQVICRQSRDMPAMSWRRQDAFASSFSFQIISALIARWHFFPRLPTQAAVTMPASPGIGNIAEKLVQANNTKFPNYIIFVKRFFYF